MPPHDGIASGTPRPRNESPASVRIAPATPKVATTISEALTLGRMWRQRMRGRDRPSERAASTYVRSRTASVSARTTRAYVAQLLSPTTRMMLRTLGPSTPMTVMASRMNGNANCMSASRMTRWSARPPRMPAVRPRLVPTLPASSTADTPISAEVRAPWMTRLRMSRPSWSVPSTARSPSGVRAVGGVKRASRRCSFGSAGASRPGSSAQRATSATASRPSPAPGDPMSARVRRPLGKAHPRIQRHVQEVDRDVQEDQARRYREHDGLQQGDVLVHHGLDGQTPDARVREDRLGDDGAAQQVAQLQPDRRHDRNRAVPQRVPEDHAPFADPLGARRGEQSLVRDREA